jgi:hypothetical protein
MNVDEQLTTLRAVTDRVEIQETLARYATAVDAGRWELLHDVFTDGAVIDFTANGGFATSSRRSPTT